VPELLEIVSIQLSLEGRLALVAACLDTPSRTLFSAGKLEFGVEVAVCVVLSISFEVSTTVTHVVQGPAEPACALPDVI
jgi:hypothetical protein